MHRYMHTCMHACHTFQHPQQQLAYAGTRWAKLRNTGDLVRAATDRVRGEYLVEYLMDEGEVR
jgi:hypothetical protein